MIDLDALKSIRYVVDPRGRKAAIQVDLKTWMALMQYLEDLEDRDVLKTKLARLRLSPEKSGAVSWDDVHGEW